MKINLSTNAQRWRLAALVLCMIAFVLMLVPGSRTWCNQSELHPYATNHHYGTYLGDAYCTVTLCSLGLTVISMLIIFHTLRRKTNNLILWGSLCNILAVLAAYDGLVFYYPWRCTIRGHGIMWFPFVPPLFSILTAIAAISAWVLGKKETPPT